jgi:hypothetical protein
VCIPIVDWSTASEKSYPESEDRADNVPRQGDLNHEGILCNSGQPRQFAEAHAWRFVGDGSITELGTVGHIIKYVTEQTQGAVGVCGALEKYKSRDTRGDGARERAPPLFNIARSHANHGFESATLLKCCASRVPDRSA